MNAFRNILLSIFAILVIFLGLNYIIPTQWSVERSIVIQATPEKMYPLIANFNSGWPQWSAFDALFPDLAYTTSGPEEGVGATRSWTSPANTGSQSITKADQNQGIEYVRNCISGDCIRGQIQFTPIEGGTIVRWIDTGSTGNTLISRLKSYWCTDMESMAGNLYEQSLLKLKKLAEGKE